MHQDEGKTFTDNSKIIVEALVRSGADVFIGYPITPANLLYYYASVRFPVFMAAPDEITTLQWMSGFSATGKIPVTATSFPGFALMIESINMAYMMELPMIIVLVQRLGPATGTATTGAQGDIALLNGMISGGMTLPVFNFYNPLDCWDLTSKAVEYSVLNRTPVAILTSKEEMMTKISLKTARLKNISKVERKYYQKKDTYIPYKAENNLVPPFLPLGNKEHQVRITSSTHNQRGIIQNSTAEALNNSKRLHYKNVRNMSNYSFYEFDEDPGAETLLISFGVTALASKEAIVNLRSSGKKVSLLIAQTLLPVPQIYFDICARYKNIIVAEENLTGQYRQILFGGSSPAGISGVNDFGTMINPHSIIKEVQKHV